MNQRKRGNIIGTVGIDAASAPRTAGDEDVGMKGAPGAGVRGQ